jgi:PII-like signaling protein
MSTEKTAPKQDWIAHSLKGVCLRFIVHENRKIHGQIAHDWLLLKAKELGIHGGSAFHGIAGFGRHGVLHEQTFWELAGDLPVEIRFVCSEDEAFRLLDAVEDEKLSVFYAITPASYGIAGANKADWTHGLRHQADFKL